MKSTRRKGIWRTRGPRTRKGEARDQEDPKVGKAWG